MSYQPPGYQPGNFGPGGMAAPPYGRPPRKNRAGLIIVLMLVLLIAVLGVGGVVAYRLVADWRSSNPGPGPSAAPPISSPTPQRSVPTPSSSPATKPPATKPPTTKPSVKPATTVGDLARRFVAQLNANNPIGASALACEGSKRLIPTLMQAQLSPPTRLTLGTAVGQQLTFVFPLSGTTKGATVSGVLVIHNLPTEPLCIRAFTLTAR
ncbi:hypothetical protein ACWCOV_27490 [Kribbella sp. NPDC002412]